MKNSLGLHILTTYVRSFIEHFNSPTIINCVPVDIATNRNGLIHHIGCLITQSDRNGPILVLVSTEFDHTGCLITLSNRNGPILDLVYPILTIFLTYFQPILADLITESDKAVRAVHSCQRWFKYYFTNGISSL